mmetsp:Transcript_22130/g.34831  ORF Transcript_22130/g.34831 Transcript_22130/m.34831 type:complete len:314 (-) Transcript_22130:37-978(-)
MRIVKTARIPCLQSMRQATHPRNLPFVPRSDYSNPPRGIFGTSNTHRPYHATHSRARHPTSPNRAENVKTRRGVLRFLAVAVLALNANQVVARASDTLESDATFSRRIRSERNIRALVIEGVGQFKKGSARRSVECFDRVIDLSPPTKPFLWQRGISLYYADDFEASAEQFSADVAANPTDVEEAVWFELCRMRQKSLQGDRTETTSDDTLLMSTRLDKDPRPVMRAVLFVFRRQTSPEDLLKQFPPDQDPHDYFYANLYAGLWYEGKNEETLARSTMLAAVNSPYAMTLNGRDDYMVNVAHIHSRLRGWITT